MQNVHPLLVHFPVAFLTAAVLAELAHGFVRRPGVDALARWLLYLGTVGAALAALSGWLGEQTVAPVAHARESIDEHQTLGYLTLGTAALLSFWRWGTAAHGGPRPRALFTAGLLGLGYLLWNTAHEGGELVYEYGVGTRLTAPGGPLAEEPRERPEERRDVPRREDFR